MPSGPFIDTSCFEQDSVLTRRAARMDSGTRSDQSTYMGLTDSDPCVHCCGTHTTLSAIFSIYELYLVCNTCGQGFTLEQTEDGEWVSRK
jgi:hypothetical protein